MRNAAQLLEELCEVDESHRIDAKRASQVGRSVLETICAFANEPGLGGGHLLLGVTTDPDDLFGNTYRVEGVADADKLQSDLASQCATAFNRPLRPQVNVESLHGKSVVVVFVPEVAATDKPIYLKSLGLPRGAYRRVGPTDQEGTDDDLIALYAEHAQDTFDASVVTDGDLNDIDLDALRNYRQMRRESYPDADELGWSNDDLLRAIGCIKAEGGELKPTVAGILLFGTTMALRRCFPMMRVDYIRIPGRRWVEDPDRRFDTLEIRAPLFVAIRRATNTVRDELLQSFQLPEGSLTRTNEPTLPLRVIREAIVNAVMHRSYRIHGPVQIIRYANRLEIRNPGHSIKAEEQLGEPGSETRNPRIAAVLHEVNVAETKGSGIRVMRELMLSNNLLPPTLESSRRPDRFVATFLFHHFLQPDDLDWLQHLTNAQLSDEEARALVFVREVGAIDNAAYRGINRTHTLNASTHLRRLRDLDLLRPKSGGRTTYYVPGPAFTALQAEPAGTNTHQPANNSHQLGQDSHQLQVTIPDELQARVPAACRKPRRSEIRSLLIDLCQWRPCSARELTLILHRRDPKPLVRDYLTPMVAEGLLAYTIPAMEKHPEQRYTAPGTTMKSKSDPS